MSPSIDPISTESSQRTTRTTTAKFRLELTPDEIEWLLYELLPHAQRRYQEIGLEPVAVEVVYTRRQWERELMNAGWRPF